MGASRPQTPRCFLVLDYLFSSTRKLQFYVELALIMEGTILTREEALRRFQSAKQIKQACIERMKCELSSVYEKQTGKKVDYLFIL